MKSFSLSVIKQKKSRKSLNIISLEFLSIANNVFFSVMWCLNLSQELVLFPFFYENGIMFRRFFYFLVWLGANYAPSDVILKLT